MKIHEARLSEVSSREVKKEKEKFSSTHSSIEKISISLKDCRSSILCFLRKTASFALLVPKRILRTAYFKNVAQDLRVEETNYYDRFVWLIRSSSAKVHPISTPAQAHPPQAHPPHSLHLQS